MDFTISGHSLLKQRKAVPAGTGLDDRAILRVPACAECVRDIAASKPRGHGAATKLDRVENGGPGGDINPAFTAKDIRHDPPRPRKPATVLAALNDKPWRAAPRGAVIDRRCARWPSKSAVGAEECLRARSNKRMGGRKHEKPACMFRKPLHSGVRLENEGMDGCGRTKE
jgi:hypothetical protein